jgi:tripartite-type tricarboxylate transporter receptor subunit TctC
VAKGRRAHEQGTCEADRHAEPIVARLNAAINASVASTDLQARFAELGLAPTTGTPVQFAAFFAAETRKWTGNVAVAPGRCRITGGVAEITFPA